MFFKKNKTEEPLEYESRKYFENNILFLEEKLLKKGLEDIEIYTPTKNYFPFQKVQDESQITEIAKFISKVMDIDFNEIDLQFFNDGINELDQALYFMETATSNNTPTSLYFDKDETGKYTIGINLSSIKTLDDLVATISHEFAHIKLLGELNLEENDEYLTDLTTLVYGFGIMSANAQFNINTSTYGWTSSSGGYLSHIQWAYSLALLCFIRENDKLEWSKYLNKQMKIDMMKSLDYMLKNENEIFKFED